MNYASKVPGYGGLSVFVASSTASFLLASLHCILSQNKLLSDLLRIKR